MNTGLTRRESASLAASVAPEDLRCGDFVAILNEVLELPSFYWFDTEQSKRDELVRVRYIPARSGTPLKVQAICLPFVFVKPPFGESETIDVRRVQLARLNPAYARKVRKDLRKQQSLVNCSTID
jgi:hypothetical protein